MNMAHFAAQKFAKSMRPIAFGECLSEAVTEQQVPASDARTCPDRFSREHSLWSRPSLRSRLGIDVSEARPLLAGLSSAPSITARPFGLGARFDGVPAGSAGSSLSILAPTVNPTTRTRRLLPHKIGRLKLAIAMAPKAEPHSRLRSLRTAKRGPERHRPNNPAITIAFKA